MDMLPLDLDSYRFDKIELVAACLYFEIGLHYNKFNRRQVAGMPEISSLLIFLEQEAQTS